MTDQIKIKKVVFPLRTKMAFMFLYAVLRFMFKSCPLVTQVERQKRLWACKKCICEVNGRCVLCGCFVHLKTWCRHEDCQLGYWK